MVENINQNLNGSHFLSTITLREFNYWTGFSPPLGGKGGKELDDTGNLFLQE